VTFRSPVVHTFADKGRPESHYRITTGPAGLTMPEQEVDELVAVELHEHGSRAA
jgi:hypothetical protein